MAAAGILFSQKWILSSSLVSLVFVSFYLQNGFSRQVVAAPASETHYVVQNLGSLLPHRSSDRSGQPPTACNASTTTGTQRKGASLKLVHKLGPCCLLDSSNPSLLDLDQILLDDQYRVKWINAMFASKKTVETENKPVLDSAITIPNKDGRTIGGGNYVVTIGLGTPKKDLTLAFDTGSSFTWTQCKPCKGSCYLQKDPIFDPASSQSYENLPCNGPTCMEVGKATSLHSRNCSSNPSQCVYVVQYGDSSFSIGYAAKEKLTLGPSDVFDSFYFGCGQDNEGLFQGSAGLLGLGRDSLSIVSQTAQKYGKFFTYCIPSSLTSTGHLTFGKDGLPSKPISYTTLASKPQYSSAYYFVELIGIKVGGQQLSIPASVFSSPGTIIDSGTVITRLPATAYAALRSAFRAGMASYPLAQPISLLDTCYDLSKYTTVSIPKITFLFSGGAELDVVAKGILYVRTLSQACLAFAGNSNLGIIGNTQQKTYDVVHDVAGGKLGFSPGGCV